MNVPKECPACGKSGKCNEYCDRTCACGCGQKTTLYRGRSTKFIVGHQFKGRHHTPEEKERRRLRMLGEKNPEWRGDEVSYCNLHMYVKRHLPKPELCEMCKQTPPYDLANKGVYNRELENWAWLCRRCHMISDGRMGNLKQYATN